MAKIGNRTTGFQGRQAFGHVGGASDTQVGEFGDVSGYDLANPSYARQAWYNTGYDQGNVFEPGRGSGNLSYAAARSGVVNPAGYRAIRTAEEVNAAAHASKKAKIGTAAGDAYQHSGAFARHTTETGFGNRGTRPIWSGLRFRRSQVFNRSTGWVGLLTQSTGPNKAFALGGGGRGQSSADTTKEVYNTIETRIGTRAAFTDEVWNEAKASFSQTWAGFKDLGDTGETPFLPAYLGQMFKRENPNIGFARRVKLDF